MIKLFAVYQCNRCDRIQMQEYPVALYPGTIQEARQEFPENIICDCTSDTQGIAPLKQFVTEPYEPQS